MDWDEVKERPWYDKIFIFTFGFFDIAFSKMLYGQIQYGFVTGILRSGKTRWELTHSLIAGSAVVTFFGWLMNIGTNMLPQSSTESRGSRKKYKE
eukprot:TRINITY_DN15350_c0_g1_i1.p1 TRINITY_DN15350_c0_g1~~TRINITY_DN15350_c0_g1_i1.p1  ORF type:complete len:95 (-),score=8.48 TRINITY_DN15350_c0_g1_i1:182-466(-)